MKGQRVPKLPGLTFEALKVYGGKIHAAEAILETLPIGAPSGWDK